MFQKLQLNPNDVKVLKGSLIRLGELVQVRSHVTLEATCCKGVDTNAIEVIYLIMESASSYNIILDRPSINALGAIISI